MAGESKPTLLNVIVGIVATCLIAALCAGVAMLFSMKEAVITLAVESKNTQATVAELKVAVERGSQDRYTGAAAASDRANFMEAIASDRKVLLETMTSDRTAAAVLLAQMLEVVNRNGDRISELETWRAIEEAKKQN